MVLCSPVWAGTFAPPLRTFFADNDLSGKNVAVIASSSSGNAGKCIAQLKDAAHADNIVDAISLVDPKTKPSEENDKKISEFIEKLRM